MTAPADTGSQFFAVVDGVLMPQPWMQHRRVASERVPAVSRSYDVTGGGNKHDPIQQVIARWVNTTPVPQWVYATVTRGGSRVTLQARSRAYISDRHGWVVDIEPPPDEPPPDEAAEFDMIEANRLGVGLDMGYGGALNTGGAYCIGEHDLSSTTTPHMPHITGWEQLAPGERCRARVDSTFISEFWENTNIDGSENNCESSFLAGELRVDIWAVPVVNPPHERPVPQIIAWTHDREVMAQTILDRPAGTDTGDVMLAVMCNQWGRAAVMNPPDDTWEPVLTVDGGAENVHTKAWLHTVYDIAAEPATYTFTDGIISETTVVLFTLRGASRFIDDGWQGAGRYTRQAGVLGPIRGTMLDTWAAPSIGRRGQLLIVGNYISHGFDQADPGWGYDESFLILRRPDDTRQGPARQGNIFQIFPDGRITALKFWRGPSLLTTRKVELWRGNAEKVVEVYSDEPDPSYQGWVTVPLPSPVDVVGPQEWAVVFEEHEQGTTVMGDRPRVLDNFGHAAFVDGLWEGSSVGTTLPPRDNRNMFSDLVFNVELPQDQVGIDVTSPPGFVEVFNENADVSHLALAYRDNPDNPTGEHPFVASEPPMFPGNDIAFSILVPGQRPVPTRSAGGVIRRPRR